MRTLTSLLIAAFFVTTMISVVEAKPHRIHTNDYREYTHAKHYKRKNHRKYRHEDNTDFFEGRMKLGALNRSSMTGDRSRPGKWCGWWMRTVFGGGPEFNLARNWSRRGSPSGPRVGAVVVWPHHVGMITGRAPNGQWIVKSGNDGGRVRERARSVSGAIAFRTL